MSVTVSGNTIRPVLIRPVLQSDLLAVRTQLVETWHATYDTIYGPEMVRDITQRWHSLIRLAAQLNGANSTFLLAEANTQILGSSYAEVEGDTAKLYRLYIHPTAQRQGLGARLMAETFARLPDAQFQRLEVEPRNQTAIAFYERASFTRAGVIADTGRPDGIAAYVYERRGA